MDEGCIHSKSATDAQVESFGTAVRLQLAQIMSRSEFHAACEVCNNTSLPICCLDCDFIGCPHHSHEDKRDSGNSSEHKLGCCLGTDFEGALWCFPESDVILDKRFERKRMSEIEQALRVKLLKEPFEQASKDLDSLSAGASASGRHLKTYHANNGLRGLVNLGATCYVSVVLQSLVHNPLVRAFFLGGGHQRELCHYPSCLACAVDRLYTEFFASPSVLGYGITDLLISLAEKKPVMGAGSTEQDAHEFYLMLLNDLHSSHLSSSMGEKSEDPTSCSCVAHRNFGGTIESTLSCTCGQVTQRFEPIVDLGLDLNPSPRAEPTTLSSALRRFITSELIANYTCENCGLQNTTSKTLKLSQLPPILMIQLKRFKHLSAKGSIKMDTAVDFDLQFDISPYTSQRSADSDHTPTEDSNLVYELYGIICHTGTLDTGHYTCMMKHSSGQWYNFDDATVTTVDVDSVIQAKQAYLLFYVVKWAV